MYKIVAIGSFLVSLSFQARKHLKEQNELPDLKDPAMKDAAVRMAPGVEAKPRECAVGAYQANGSI